MELARTRGSFAAPNIAGHQCVSRCRLVLARGTLQTVKHAHPAAAAAAAAAAAPNRSSHVTYGISEQQQLTRLQQQGLAAPQRDGCGTRNSRSHNICQEQFTTSTSPTAAAAAAAAATSSATTAAAVHLLLTAGSAAAAKVEVDVPDFLVEHNPLDAVLHSPVLAVGVAVLALLLFPRFMRVAINFLFYPVIAALLAYLAISHPAQTATSVYLLLEFVKDHPAASSVAVVVAAGVLLGPDILAGTALAGVLVLLAAQAGFVQLPQPQLPKQLVQKVVAKQIGNAGAAFKQRVLDLVSDNGGSDSSNNKSNKLLLPAGRADGRQPWQQQQQQPAPAVAGSPAAAAEQPTGAQAALQALKGFSKRAAAAGKGLAERAKDALPEQQEVQAGLQAAGKGLGSAAQQLGSRVQDLGDRVQQAGLGERGQGMRERAGLAASAAAEKAKGLREMVGSLTTGQAVIAQQQQQLEQGAAATADRGGSRDSKSSGMDGAAADAARASRVESVLANS